MNTAQKLATPLNLIIALLAGVLIGGVGFYLVDQSTSKDQKSNQTSVSDPQAAEYLKSLNNSVFTEWMGSVEGKVVAKDNESFTIESKGEKLKIFIHPGFTKFFGKEKPNGERDALKLENIPLNEKLIGGITMPRGKLLKRPGEIIGNVFTISD